MKGGDETEKNELQNKTKILDFPIHLFGFELEDLSPEKVTARLRVTEKCCQPFRVLHGGVSALVSEALASIGAHIACGFKRVAGVHLSIHHLKTAKIGDEILVVANPVRAGKKIQVWEVKLNRVCPNPALISSSRVTLLVNLPVPKNATDAEEHLKRYAKL